MTQATCLQNQHLQVVQSNQSTTEIEETFADNLSYIEFLVAEVQLWVVSAYLRLKNIEQFSEDDDFFSALRDAWDVSSASELEALIAETALERQQKEKSAVCNGVSLKFKELVEEYGLNDFKKKVLQLVLVADTSLEFKALFDRCDIEFWNRGFSRSELEIGVILSILCEDDRSQLACRSCFSIDRPLVKHEIITLSGRHYSFLENNVELHERISRFCLDDHNVYDTELLCITAERPVVKFSQVILADNLKDDLLRYAESFIENNKKGQGLGKAFGYGAGLTCLFYGLSGTGKTMLAHGLANNLGCQLFSINIGGLEHEDISFEEAVKHIFREARLANGIVFLDECDDLLGDSSHMSRTFLIEVEKAECITILATNKTVTMDPALDRRISLKIPFGLPGEKERLAIWQALLPEGMRYGNDVDLAEFAVKYQFTGGLIKNSLLMAAGSATMKARGVNAAVSIDAAEIHKAAGHQARSMFDLSSVGRISTPRLKLSDLIVRHADMIRLEKVAAILPEMQQKKQGLCGLICSENVQTGVESVEAVATENGLMLRRFNLSQLLSDSESSGQNDNKIIDPFTQQAVSMLDYVFSQRPGQQEVLLIVDDSSLLADFLESDDANNAQDWKKFKRLMQDFHSILFVVSTQVDESRVPIEFACHISLSYPAEDTQILAWQTHFSELSDSEVVELVERYPMHIHEIDLVARQTGITAQLNGFANAGTADITALAKRLRGVRKMPFLFGEQRK